MCMRGGEREKDPQPIASWRVLDPSVMSQRGIWRKDSPCNQTSGEATNQTRFDFSLDDSTIDGNLLAPCAASQSVVRALQGHKWNGYPPHAGRPEAKEAIVHYWDTCFAGQQGMHCKVENVIVTCGTSEAFLIALTALCDEGDNVLLPIPCPSHYQLICKMYGITALYYRCDHEKNWEIDFDHLRSLVDGKTKAILMNNPSNPCGSNFSRQHIADLVRVCEELQLPLIADEIYAGIVFSGETFTSVAEFDTPVPRFIISGLSKRFMVPGWRFGWVMLMDRDGCATDVVRAMQDMHSLSMGPNTALQGALSEIIEKTPNSYFADNIEFLSANATAVSDIIQSCHGLSCTPHQGAMAIMVMINFSQLAYESDIEFCEKLLAEEDVRVSPGSLFHMPNCFQVVLTRANDITIDGMGRIRNFCERHRRK